MLVTLKFKDSNTDIELTITNKYAFLSGDSGVGKSFLIELFNQVKASPELGTFETSIPHVIFNSTISKDDLLRNYNGGAKPTLWICDEEFAKLVVQFAKRREIYCVVITRENLNKTSTDFADGGVQYSPKCFYELQRCYGKTTLRQKYTDFINTITEPFDLFFTEDSGYGNRFLRSLLGARVLPIGGKDKIISAFKQCSVNHNMHIGLFTDLGNLGFIYPRLLAHIAREHLHVSIFDIECFEQLFYESPMLNPRCEIYKEFQVHTASTEVFCEHRLLQKTKSQPYLCDHEHNIMSPCWCIDCIHPTPCTQFMNDSINRCILGEKPLCSSFTYKHKMQYVLAGDEHCPLPGLLDVKFSQKYPVMQVAPNIMYTHDILRNMLRIVIERTHVWINSVDAGKVCEESGTVVPIPCYGAYFTTEPFAVLFGKDYGFFATDVFIIDVSRSYLFPIFVDGRFIPQVGYSYNELLSISKQYQPVVL